MGEIPISKMELANHGPWKGYCFGSKVLLEHSCNHLFYVLSVAAFTLQWQSPGVATETIWLTSLKHLPPGPLQKKFANPCKRTGRLIIMII